MVLQVDDRHFNVIVDKHGLVDATGERDHVSASTLGDEVYCTANLPVLPSDDKVRMACESVEGSDNWRRVSSL
jgi:hypothetical protein